MKTKALCLLLLCVASLTALGQAGGGGCNGGDAIADGEIIDQVQSGFRLLDFYQAKMRDENDVIGAVTRQFYASPDLSKIRLKRDLGRLLQDQLKMVDQSRQMRLVALLGQQDPLLAYILAAPFAMYSWERQSNVKYVDDYSSPDDYGKGKPYAYGDGLWRLAGGVHQVGRRILDKIEIAEIIFSRMYDFDQIGLLMHEAIYAMFVKAPELPYGQDPVRVRGTVADTFRYWMGLSATNPLESSANFEYAKLLPQARALLVPGEVLTAESERGQYYRIQAQKFTLEFRFEDYDPSATFHTKYLQPKLILK
jgi:hypothetical protein